MTKGSEALAGIHGSTDDLFKTDTVDGARTRHRDVPQGLPLGAAMRGVYQAASRHEPVSFHFHW